MTPLSSTQPRATKALVRRREYRLKSARVNPTVPGSIHPDPLMKNIITILACATALTLATTSRAADKEKEQEIKGEGCCLKCEMKKSDTCLNAISVKEKDGKTTLYVLEHNDVSKAFHKNLCSSTAKVVAKGVVKKQGDKNILVASKIEKAEK